MDNAGEFSRLRLLNVIASSKSLLPSEVRVTGSEVEDIWGDVIQPPAVTIPAASGIQGTGLDERWLLSNPNLRIPCVLSVGHQREQGGVLQTSKTSTFILKIVICLGFKESGRRLEGSAG